jgi:hypothetical protein
VPSLAVPERMTPIARFPATSARERMKWSIGMFFRSEARVASRRVPREIVMTVLGGMT